MSLTRPRDGSTSLWVAVLLGFGAIVFDGYDLIVYGSTVPVLLAHPEWHLTPEQAGHIGSMALLGMFFGALVTGALTDRFGRRVTFIGSLAWFSLMMIGAAASTSPDMLGTFRFLAGLGFGGIAPTAIALVVESAPAAKRQFYNALMLIGFPVGGILAGLLAINFLASAGFRVLYLFGALPLVTLVPLAFFLLPETQPKNAPAATQSEATTDEPTRATDLLKGRAAVATVLFALANFAGFLLVFGLNTWLPQLMRQQGYDLGSALQFLLALNVGAVFGAIVGARLADRWGSRPVAILYFLVAALSLLTLTGSLPKTAALVAIFIAGGAAIGNQIVVYGFVATHYPTPVRATALGLTSGIGRLGAVAGPSIGGYLIQRGYGLHENVWVFASVAACGAVVCALVASRTRQEARGTAGPTAGASTPQPGAVRTSR